MIIVRPATAFDAQQLYALWLALWEHEAALHGGEHPTGVLPAEAREQWAARYVGLLASPGVACFVAVENSLDKAVGYVLISVGQRDIGTPRQFLQMHEMFVQPEYRGRAADRAAPMLEAAAAAWSAQYGLERVVVTCVPAPKQVARWERRGFKPVMVTLERAIKDGR